MITAAVGNSDTLDVHVPYDLQRVISSINGSGEPQGFEDFKLDGDERGQVLNAISRIEKLNLADARPESMLSGTGAQPSRTTCTARWCSRIGPLPRRSRMPRRRW